MLNCIYCEQEFKAPHIHQVYCKLNPSRKFAKNQFSNGEHVVSKETRVKLSRAAKIQNETMWTEEMRKKHSAVMKKVVVDNPDSYSKYNVSGRVKMYEYKGTMLKGTWELKFAKWLDGENITWTNDIKPIPYKWNGSWHLYFPDFYLAECRRFVEVKGYKRDRDVAKWAAVDNLVIIMQKEITEIENGSFTKKDMLNPSTR